MSVSAGSPLRAATSSWSPTFSTSATRGCVRERRHHEPLPSPGRPAPPDKHLRKVFGPADPAGALLLFDEADAFSGRHATTGC